MDRKPSSQRELHLEGLRGLAALSVVLFHYLSVFFPRAFVGSTRTVVQPHNRYELWWYGHPWGAFTSGAFGVAVFFILSGYVLSILFFKTKDVNVLRSMALKRYVRLCIPAAASIFIVLILMYLHLPQTLRLSEILHNPGILSLWNFPPNLWHATYQAFWGAYFSGQDPVYNPVLWTMRYEFLGSMLIFGFLALVGRLKFRWVAYALLIMFTYSSWYFGFILGMMLADITTNRQEVTRFFTKYYLLLLPAALIGLYLGGYPEGDTPGSWYNLITIHFPSLDTNFSFWLTIGAFLVTAAISWSRLGRRLLSLRPLVKLGSYTYSIYLTHLIIMACLLPVIFVGLRGLGVGYAPSSVISVALCLPVVLALGKAYTRYIDVPAIRLSRAFSKAVIEERFPAFQPSLPLMTAPSRLRLRSAWEKLLRRPGRPVEPEPLKTTDTKPANNA